MNLNKQMINQRVRKICCFGNEWSNFPKQQ